MKCGLWLFALDPSRGEVEGRDHKTANPYIQPIRKDSLHIVQEHDGTNGYAFQSIYCMISIVGTHFFHCLCIPISSLSHQRKWRYKNFQLSFPANTQHHLWYIYAPLCMRLKDEGCPLRGFELQIDTP